MPDAKITPTSWRILKKGVNQLFKKGEEMTLSFTQAELDGIAEFQRKKGEKIPIDSRHALFLAAKKAGVEEVEALKSVPQGVAALGFGNLTTEKGDLWIADVEWTPLAKTMLEQGMLRYFSPVIRGMDGSSPLRITSVAMDNVPALSDLPVLAAGQEAHNQEEARMERTLKALQALLGNETLALGEESDEAIAAKLNEVREQLAEMQRKVEEAAEQIAALEAAKKGAEETRKADEARIRELEMSAETAKRDAMLTAAVSTGKITNAQRKSLSGMETAALGEFLKSVPEKAVPCRGSEPMKEEETCLTEEEKAVAAKMGIPEGEMLESKKTKIGD